jgi:hypothetical protein
VSEIRNCPTCGTPMVLRLGSYECERCPPPPAPVLSPPSAAQLLSKVVQTPAAQGDPLAREKRAYLSAAIIMFGMTAGQAIALSTPTGMMIQSVGTPANQAMMYTPASAVGIVLGGLIGLGLQAGALLLQQLWMKWSCLGCSTIGVLGSLSVLVGLLPVWEGPFGRQPQDYLRVALTIWLVTLLWRDLSNQRSLGY